MQGVNGHDRELQALQAVEMLKAVLDGETYSVVAERCGVSRTAVERRIKAVAGRLCARIGIEGLNASAAAFVQRLREHKEPILAALVEFDPSERPPAPAARALSRGDIDRAAQRIRIRSTRPWYDQALFYVLLVTGARPLEIARLEVRDYLNADGSVRVTSELREEISIAGKARPIFFTSPRLDAALGYYLSDRASMRHGIGVPGSFRGLDPRSRLFLSPEGDALEIRQVAPRRYLCRAIQSAYRKLFRHAELTGVTPLNVRVTLASFLYERGADEDQVGLVLGIDGRRAVRELLPRPRPTVQDLVNELV